MDDVLPLAMEPSFIWKNIDMQDGGDGTVKVSPRDIVYTLTAEDAAAGKSPTELASTDLRSSVCLLPHTNPQNFSAKPHALPLQTPFPPVVSVRMTG